MQDADKVGNGANAVQVPQPDGLTHDELKAKATANGIPADYLSCSVIVGADGQITFMTYGRTRSESDLRADLARLELRERQRRSILRKPLTWFEDLLDYAYRLVERKGRPWPARR